MAGMVMEMEGKMTTYLVIETAVLPLRIRRQRFKIP
jgi:hypothetical protein